VPYNSFGASSLSFEPVLATLASSLLVDATAIAHDAPGFGLTQEPERGEDALYGFASNARLGTALVAQVEAEERGVGGGEEVLPVFVGHSMGAITSAFMALDRLTQLERAGRLLPASSLTTQTPKVTLILVAPAILPMRESPTRLPPAARRFLGSVPRVGRFLWQNLGVHVAVLGTLRYFLRSLAYSKDFWQRGLGMAWGNGSGPGPVTLAHYKIPSLKKGWDRSLGRFVLAPLQRRAPGDADGNGNGDGDGGGGGNEGRAVMQAQGSYANLVEKLAARVRQGSLRLLLVHGTRDRVVPLPNTRRLHAAIPGSALWELAGVGHVPHEEAPEDFVQQIVDFLLLTEAWEEGGEEGGKRADIPV
jgi:pimeloyl-ACP methyl ester carboxylesterase